MSIKTIEDSSLTAIAEAIRDKNGETTTYTPAEMAPAIEALDTSGGGEDTSWMQTEFSGNLNYFNYNGEFNFYLNQVSDKLSFTDIDSLNYAFAYSSQSEALAAGDNYIPTDIYGSGETAAASNFASYNQSSTPCTLHNVVFSSTMSYFYSRCYVLTDLSGLFDNCSNGGTTNGLGSYAFVSDYRLRAIPDDLTPLVNSKVTTASYHLSNNFCNYCYALDQVLNFPFDESVTRSATSFSNFCNQCFHLSHLTFQTNEDGSVKTCTAWSNQTIPLSSSHLGYGTTATVMGDLAGFTSDTQITNAESYEALKDNPDAWTTLAAYSRYDHDSAVETINSLPDVTSGSSNTITFLGESGSATDAGAINTLTDEEIAVGTDKGWTISIT